MKLLFGTFTEKETLHKTLHRILHKFCRGLWNPNYTRNSTNTVYGASSFTGTLLAQQTLLRHSQDFTGTFGNFVGERDFETTFTGTFETDFIGTFETTFTGNFIGALINAGTETIETYTLYVRTA